jgi:hypothetical protein
MCQGVQHQDIRRTIPQQSPPRDSILVRNPSIPQLHGQCSICMAQVGGTIDCHASGDFFQAATKAPVVADPAEVDMGARQLWDVKGLRQPGNIKGVPIKRSQQ